MYYVFSLLLIIFITIINFKFVPKIILKKDTKDTTEPKKKFIQIIRISLTIVGVVLFFYLFLELTDLIPYFFIPKNTMKIEIAYYKELITGFIFIMSILISLLIPSFILKNYELSKLELDLNRSAYLTKDRRRKFYFLGASIFSIVSLLYLFFSTHYFYYNDDFLYKSDMFSFKHEKLSYEDIKHIKIKTTKNNPTTFVHFNNSKPINISFDDLNFSMKNGILFYCDTFEIKTLFEEKYNYECFVEGRKNQ